MRENMKEFKNYHPIVNFIFFFAVIGFSMFLMHPVCLGISLASGFAYSVLTNGKKAAVFGILGILPMMLIAAILNPAFSHEGVTVLAYLPKGNPLTLESVIYGLAAAAMLGAVVCWFSCYNAIMTSDKFLYLFGKVIPSLSLVISMTLRFVPRFKEQYRRVADAQRCMGRDPSKGSIFSRIGKGIRMLSIMISWMLESSVEIGESMKSRGYGLRKRTAFSLFVFSRRDVWLLVFELLVSIYVLMGAVKGGVYYSYYPMLAARDMSVYSFSIFAAYFALCTMPIFVEMWESYRWNALKSKI